jgi:hypothetical protein
MKFPRNIVSVILTLVALLFAVPSVMAFGLDGEIKVKNNRHVPVELVIDGRTRFTIAAQQVRLLKNIPNGIRLVELRSAGVAKQFRRVSVPLKGRVRLKLSQLAGRASIKNNTAVTLNVSMGGVHLATLRSGSGLTTGLLRMGKYTLQARPVRHFSRPASNLVRTFTIHSGKRSSVVFTRWFSQVTVKNPYTRSVNLKINGRMAGRIKAGSSVTTNRIKPGMHALTLTKSGRTLVTVTRFAKPGQAVSWQPLPSQRGDLIITNKSRRPIFIKIDKQQFGMILAGSQRMFRNLPAGHHRLTTRSRRSLRKSRRIFVAQNSQSRVAVGRRGFLPAHREVRERKFPSIRVGKAKGHFRRANW